jgi:hypothetical protein
MSLAPITPDLLDLAQAAKIPGKLPVMDAPPPMPNLASLGTQQGPPLAPALQPLVTNPRAQHEQALQSMIAAHDAPHPAEPGFWHKLAHYAARVGNIAGNTLAPGVMLNLPGADLNQDLNASIATRQLGGLEAQDRQDKALADRSALESAQMDTKRQSLDLEQQKVNDAEDKEANAHALQLARMGQVEITGADGQKHIVDDPGSQVYQMRQALTQYHSAQMALDQARAELANASNDPSSPAYKLAMAKAQTAQQNAAAASERAQAYMLNATAGNLGLTPSGQIIPGAPITDSGQPVGSRFAHGVLPTGQMRGRAELADSARNQIATMTHILETDPGLFGPASGRYTTMTQWLGSQDPAAQQFKAASNFLIEHASGMFGSRSEGVLKTLKDVFGNNETNPAAALAALRQAEETAELFQREGTPRTVGSDAAKPGGANPAPDASATRTYKGHTYKKGADNQWHLQR